MKPIPGTRGTWTSPSSGLTTVAIMLGAVAVGVVWIRVLLGTVTLKLDGVTPVPRAVPLLLGLILVCGLVWSVLPLAWRIVVTDADVRIFHLMKPRRTIRLDSVRRVFVHGSDRPRSLVLETTNGNLRITPAPHPTNEVTRCLVRLSGPGNRPTA